MSTTPHYRRYVYTTTNKASLILLGIVVVALESLFIKLLTPAGYVEIDVLKRFAWPVWSLAFVIRAGQYLLRRRQ